MAKIVSIFGHDISQQEAAARQRHSIKSVIHCDAKLFRSASQARKYFHVVSNKMSVNEYGGALAAYDIAEDIFTFCHEEHTNADLASRFAENLLLLIRSSTQEKAKYFQLEGIDGSLIMCFGDGQSCMVKFAQNYVDTSQNKTKNFMKITTMDFQISNHEVFFAGETIEV